MITAVELLDALKKPEMREGHPLLFYVQCAFAYPLVFTSEDGRLTYTYRFGWGSKRDQLRECVKGRTPGGAVASSDHEVWNVGLALERLFLGISPTGGPPQFYATLMRAVEIIVNDNMTLEEIAELVLRDSRTMGCPAVRKRMEAGK